MALSLLTFILDVIAQNNADFDSPFDATILRVARMVRLLRVLRLTKRFKNLRLLSETLVLALPALFNIGSLLFLLFFLYAVMGVDLFGTVPAPLPDAPENGGGLSEYANFSTFYWALLTLIRCITGEAYNSIMWDLVSLGGGYKLAVLYFATFFLFGAFIVLNLFIAVVIEAFSTVVSRDDFKVSEQHLELYRRVWSHYDPYAEQRINIQRDLRALLTELEPPLGLGDTAQTRDVLRFVDELNLKQHKGEVTFHDLLYALVSHAYGAGVDLGDELEPKTTSALSGARMRIQRPSNTMESNSVDPEDQRAAKSYLAAYMLQYAARRYLDEHPEDLYSNSPDAGLMEDNKAGDPSFDNLRTEHTATDQMPQQHFASAHSPRHPSPPIDVYDVLSRREFGVPTESKSRADA